MPVALQLVSTALLVAAVMLCGFTAHVPHSNPETAVPPPKRSIVEEALSKLAKVEEELVITTGALALPILTRVAVVVPMFKTPDESKP